MCTQKPPHDHSEQLYARWVGGQMDVCGVVVVGVVVGGGGGGSLERAGPH